MEAVLYRWGGFVFRYRLSILVAAAVVLIVTGALAVAGGRLNGSLEPRGQARQAADLVRAEIPQPGRSAFQLLFRASSLNATDAEFRADLLDAVAPLRSDLRVIRIVTPYDENGGGTDAGVSSDGRDALVTVYLRDDFTTAASYYQSLRTRVHPRVLTVLATGDLAVNQNLDASLDQDLGRSEEFSLPLSLLLLLIVFGTVVAALLPLGVGVFAIIGGTGVVMAMSHATDVSDLTISLISLLGLGLAIDYSLFVVSRFREELADGAVTEEALARSLATAGRAVVFSGLAVVLGLCGLLFYQGTFMPSLGAGALNGMLSSGIDRTLVDMPAWQHVGPVAWAAFSRWADLGPAGIILYPTEGIGGTLLTIAAAAVALSRRRGLTRGEVAPIYAAAVGWGEGGSTRASDRAHGESPVRVPRPCGLRRSLRSGIGLVPQCHDAEPGSDDPSCSTGSAGRQGSPRCMPA